MLERIICFLVDLTKQSGYFETVFPLARMTSKPAKIGDRVVIQSWPVQYTTKGQQDDVTIFDNKSGVAYFRLTGKVGISTPINNQVPCNDELKFDFPIRLVGCVQKKNLIKDDTFAEERLTRSLIQQLTISHSELTKDLSAKKVTFIPSNIEMDGASIAAQEYRNKGIIEINYNYAYIAIDFTASVTIKINCITPECP